MKTIHINCDLGEGGGYDAQIMPLISACNIACGGHAGSTESMEATLLLAKKNGVEIGAHPSYPDKEHFGRTSISLSPKQLKGTIYDQIGQLQKIAESHGAQITHIKPHGALYNDVAKDARLASIVVESILQFEEKWKLYAPFNSEISRLAKGKIEVVFEAFADRNYNPDYSLVSRQKSRALITKKEEVFKHVFSMFFEKEIRCKNGEEIECFADTFCLHSDTPNSVEILQYLHKKFAENNIRIYRKK